MRENPTTTKIYKDTDIIGWGDRGMTFSRITTYRVNINIIADSKMKTKQKGRGQAKEKARSGTTQINP